MSLHLPRPSSSRPATPQAPPASISPPTAASNDDTLMSPPSASSSSSSSTARLPPRNFALSNNSHNAHALARSAARDLRAATKSPFMPRKVAATALGPANGTAGGNGKERDLTGLSVEDLEDMLLRNKEVLESPATLALLPGGSTKLLASQTRIAARLTELQGLRKIRDGLERTHLEERSPTNAGVKVKTEEGVQVKREEEDEVKMEDADDLPPPTEQELSTSPLAKRRLASRPTGPQSPHSLTSSISLAESIALQQAAVKREREAAHRRAEKAAAVERSTGGRLKGAMKGESAGAIGDFMFHAASDDSEDDDEGVDVEAELSLLGLASAQARQRQALQTCRAEGGEGEVEEFGLSGQLDDEEDSQLNPYRVAYESGWTRANEEMEKDAREGGREVKP